MQTLTMDNSVKFQKFETFRNKINKFYYSNWYLALLFLIAFVFWATDLSIVSTTILLTIGSLVLITNKDISPFLPIITLMVATVSDIHYLDKQLNLILMAIVGVMLASSIIFNIFYYHQKLQKGKLTTSLILVSIALIFGGIGSITAIGYKNSLLFIFTLGVAMLLLYIFMTSCIDVPKDVDYKRYLLKLIACMTALICGEIIVAHLRAESPFFTDIKNALDRELLEVGWCNRSGLSAMLVLCIPTCFYLAETAKKYNLLWFFVSCLVYLIEISTLCRGGILFSTLEMIAIVIYLLVKGTHKKALAINIGFWLIVALIIICTHIPLVKDIFAEFDKLVTNTSGRTVLYNEAWNQFLTAPLFGVGLGYWGPKYQFRPNCIYWFHSTVMQVLASTGVFGLVCYFINYFTKFKMLLNKRNIFTVLITIGIVGFELNNLIDAFTFQPFPFVYVALLLVVIVEYSNKRENLNEEK